MKIPHVTEVCVNFTIQLVCLSGYGQRTLFSHVAENYRLKPAYFPTRWEGIKGQSSRSPIIGPVNKSFETPAVNQFF